MELLRVEASDSFHHELGPGVVEASFIDGQIKLMKGDSIQTWSHFIYSQFTSLINRHFRDYGCKTVVLAFDDRRHVPRAKAITQLKRRSGVQIIEFTEMDILPNDIPSGWKEAIMNQCFRNRVIEMVCANVPRLIEPPASGCALVVDWLEVREYRYSADSSEPVETVLSSSVYGETAIGEADIKFAFWMRNLQCPMLIEATDGDYIPIALGLKTCEFQAPVWILKAWKATTGYEYIDIDGVYSFLQQKFTRASRGRQCCPWWEIKLFITLLGLTGTDFTRNLPLISPQRMWDNLPLIIQTFDMETSDTISMSQGKRIVELLYAEAFPKHIDSFFARSSVWQQAQGSKLSARTKALIPTDKRIVCTLKNLNFLLAYWLRSHVPEANEEYGFRENSGGVLGWAD
jgi:hypothetical protein